MISDMILLNRKRRNWQSEIYGIYVIVWFAKSENNDFNIALNATQSFITTAIGKWTQIAECL